MKKKNPVSSEFCQCTYSVLWGYLAVFYCKLHSKSILSKIRQFVAVLIYVLFAVNSFSPEIRMVKFVTFRMCTETLPSCLSHQINMLVRFQLPRPRDFFIQSIKRFRRLGCCLYTLYLGMPTIKNRSSFCFYYLGRPPPHPPHTSGKALVVRDRYN